MQELRTVAYGKLVLRVIFHTICIHASLYQVQFVRYA